MDNSTRPFASTDDAESDRLGLGAASDRFWKMSSLLEHLDGPALTLPAPGCGGQSSRDNELVQVRLGLAAGLFAALRAKHAPTAAHSLRVALGCSSWALCLDLTDPERDEIEVAALLHDIGKIAVPDQVLLKPGRLTSEELRTVRQSREAGCEILGECSASQEVLAIVRYCSAWYDGGRPGFDRKGERLPLGARMLSVVDAFDVMTTDQVYRRAMSCERATSELYQHAGAQFDPELVRDFCWRLSQGHMGPSSQVARRWLEQLDAATSTGFWTRGTPIVTGESPAVDALFHQKLFDNMLDGVVFVDSEMKILLWNRACERLTGISASSVLHRRWAPSLVKMRDERLKIIADDDCPIVHAVLSGVQTIRRLTVSGRNNEQLSVDVHSAPVVGHDGAAHGATLLLHDASSQITLEERVELLHERATQDPLTQMANRAEFDRIHQQFVRTHLEQRLPCSLIMCDIDHFKKINDTYGHQAGDEALRSFSALLKQSCRPGDLAARYGGEEFVLLCAGCGNAGATQRAERIRRRLADTAQPMLYGHCITASFGVTEIQAGDTPQTMLRRADRALMQAKENGRNRVVQLGSGIQDAELSGGWRRWLSWRPTGPVGQLIERTLVSAVPLNVAVEKLRGFAADHRAKVVAARDHSVVLKVDGSKDPLRRTTDRPASLVVELRLAEAPGSCAGGSGSRTLIGVAIRPNRRRDQRRSDLEYQARQLLLSLKAYLMAEDQPEAPFENEGQPMDAGACRTARLGFTCSTAAKDRMPPGAR